ncbi:unnamed protein product [Kluyveromyces dobzhanskii CBS 2104]|uniref:WGS project CCBQ000000000 data, contig 00058 n=1 Tax=Kluyveromyces dobzhanskii CBS 2104 TaxID=1427455 RepID=A0A0A8LD64_9SACH|nr:unnamed protein product [Kluyveromyces dobzhanskii CBS 2104]
MAASEFIKVDGEVQTATVSYAFSDNGAAFGTSILSLDESQIINVSASTYTLAASSGTGQILPATTSVLLPSSLITDSASISTTGNTLGQQNATATEFASNSSSTSASARESGNAAAAAHWKPRAAISALLFVSSLLL